MKNYKDIQNKIIEILPSQDGEIQLEQSVLLLSELIQVLVKTSLSQKNEEPVPECKPVECEVVEDKPVDKYERSVKKFKGQSVYVEPIDLDII